MALPKMRKAQHAMGGGCFECPRCAFRFAQECRRNFLAQGVLAAHGASGPLTVVSLKRVAGVALGCEEFPSAREGGQGLRRSITLTQNQRLPVVGLQLEPSARRNNPERRTLAHAVRHLDRLAEMGDRLLKGGAAESLVAGLAPPFDRRIGEARLGKMMRQHLRLCGRLVGDAVPQSLRYAAMQNLAPAFQEIS